MPRFPKVRRFGGEAVKLQMKVGAGLVGCAGGFVWLIAIFLLAGFLESRGVSDAGIGRAVLASFLVSIAPIYLVVSRLLGAVARVENAVDDAVRGAEREDRRIDEAMAGGVPGQLSVADAPAEQGALSGTADGAVSVAKPPQREPSG